MSAGTQAIAPNMLTSSRPLVGLGSAFLVQVRHVTRALPWRNSGYRVRWLWPSANSQQHSAGGLQGSLGRLVCGDCGWSQVQSLLSAQTVCRHQ